MWYESQTYRNTYKFTASVYVDKLLNLASCCVQTHPVRRLEICRMLLKMTRMSGILYWTEVNNLNHQATMQHRSGLKNKKSKKTVEP